MGLFSKAPWKQEKEPEPVAVKPDEPEDAYEAAREAARMEIVYESMQRALGRRNGNPPLQHNDYCPHDWTNW